MNLSRNDKRLGQKDEEFAKTRSKGKFKERPHMRAGMRVMYPHCTCKKRSQ